MIKKYIEFIAINENEQSGKRTITKEDIDDEFLRIKEIYGYEYEVGHDLFLKSILTENEKFKDSSYCFFMQEFEKIPKEVSEEANHTCNRIEQIYKVKTNMYSYGEYLVIDIVPIDQFKEYEQVMQATCFTNPYYKKYTESQVHKINDILTQVELEDYFLRLKEIYNCTVVARAYNPLYKEGYYVHISKIDYSLIDEIEDEIKLIKKRIESIYPKLKVCITKYPKSEFYPITVVITF